MQGLPPWSLSQANMSRSLLVARNTLIMKSVMLCSDPIWRIQCILRITLAVILLVGSFAFLMDMEGELYLIILKNVFLMNSEK